MMTAATMTQRRKATTYGKTSRRPGSNLGLAAVDAFSQASELTRWDNEDKLDSRRFSGHFMRSPNPVRTLEPAGQATSYPLKPIHRSKQTGPAKDKNAQGAVYSSENKDSTIYDSISSSEDHVGLGAESPDASARKRRKLTPKGVAGEALLSLVYDDDSLQRHISAESRGDPDWKLQNCRNVANGTKLQHHKHAPERSRGGGRHSPSHGTASSAEAHEFSERKPALDGSGNEINSTSMKEESLNTQTKGWSDMPPHAAQKAKKIRSAAAVRQGVPEMLPRDPLAQRPDGQTMCPQSCDGDLDLPRTPPRPSDHSSIVTTPRQRELWGKILPEEARWASPSYLALPSLEIVDLTNQTPSKRSPTRQHTCDKAQENHGPTIRPRRIVDILHPHDDDMEHLDHDSACESPGSNYDELASQSHSEILDGNHAMKIQSLPGSQSKDTQSHCDTSSSIVPLAPSLAPSLQGGGLKVTYARQRSYLTDTDLNDVAMFSIPIVPEPDVTIQARRTGLGKKVAKFESAKPFGEVFEEAQDSQSGAMRSIHELREAGGNVRLVGELEAILDDLDEKLASSTSSRRSSLLDLALKLLEPSSCRLFIDHGLEDRLLSHISFGHDIISNSLLAALTLQLLSHAASTPLISQFSDIRIKDFLVRLLSHDQDLVQSAKLRENNMSKLARLEYTSFCNLLLKSPAWGVGKPPKLSCQILSLQCLEYIIRRTREAGSVAEILSASAIHAVVFSSIPACTSLQQPTSLSMLSLELAISILESCTISNTAADQASRWANDTNERVIGLLPLLRSWPEEDCGGIKTLTLRLCLNLTNCSPRFCEAFSTVDVISALFNGVTSYFDRLSRSTVHTRDPRVLDTLILTLGCLINLAESSDSMRCLFINLRDGDASYLDTLQQLFTKNLQLVGEVRSSQSL